MRLGDLGEFNFIDSIVENSLHDPSSIVLGIGDDCAIYKTTPDCDQVTSIDTMVEGVHFSFAYMSAFDVGYRLCAANISDVAAMGARPKQITVSLAASAEVEVACLQGIYRGIGALCQRYGVNLIGGDTVHTEGPMVLTIAIIGEVDAGRAVLRSGACLGDYIGVTGQLGLGQTGLEILSQAHLLGKTLEQLEAVYPQALVRHRRPEPQVRWGQVLADLGAHAMNDISDGLASELHEIAQASQVAMVIDEDRIPLSAETDYWIRHSSAKRGQERDCESGTAILVSSTLASTLGQATTDSLFKGATHSYDKAVAYALFGGEDFQLVFTCPEEALASIEVLEDVTIIGRVVEASSVDGPVLMKDKDGSMHRVDRVGYNHFHKDS